MSGGFLAIIFCQKNLTEIMYFLLLSFDVFHQMGSLIMWLQKKSIPVCQVGHCRDLSYTMSSDDHA